MCVCAVCMYVSKQDWRHKECSRQQGLAKSETGLQREARGREHTVRGGKGRRHQGGVRTIRDQTQQHVRNRHQGTFGTFGLFLKLYMQRLELEVAPLLLPPPP